MNCNLCYQTIISLSSLPPSLPPYTFQQYVITQGRLAKTETPTRLLSFPSQTCTGFYRSNPKRPINMGSSLNPHLPALLNPHSASDTYCKLPRLIPSLEKQILFIIPARLSSGVTYKGFPFSLVSYQLLQLIRIFMSIPSLYCFPDLP